MYQSTKCVVGELKIIKLGVTELIEKKHIIKVD